MRDAIYWIFKFSICSYKHENAAVPQCTCKNVFEIYSTHAGQIPDLLMEHLCEVFTGYLHHQVSIKSTRSNTHSRVLWFVAEQYERQPQGAWQGSLEDLTKLLVTQPKYAPLVFRGLCHVSWYNRAFEILFSKIFLKTTGMLA